MVVVRDVSLGCEDMSTEQHQPHSTYYWKKARDHSPTQAAFTPPHATFCPLLLGAPSPLAFLSPFASPSLPCAFAANDADPGNGDARNPSNTRAACSEFRINHPAYRLPTVDSAM